MTEIMVKVATIGPSAGSEPKGVKQKVASMTINMENRAKDETRRFLMFSLRGSVMAGLVAQLGP